eukprot:1132138-Prorocentrum_lima.AAC.1
MASHRAGDQLYHFPCFKPTWRHAKLESDVVSFSVLQANMAHKVGEQRYQFECAASQPGVAQSWRLN